MDVLTPIKKNVIDPTIAIGSGTYEGMKDTFTTKKGASDVAYMVVGGIAAGIVTIGILPRIPFGKLPFGREIASATTLGVGVSMSAYGKKTGNSIWTTAGIVTTLAGATSLLSMTGLLPSSVSKYMAAESGYYGDMSLKGYTPMDSVEVDRSSYQPTQDYGAETIEQEMTAGTPQVEIAQEMVGNNLDSVRQESAMGHGVTQWFGAETMNSATATNRRMDMKKFAASTDVGGNRVRTGDDSMANVVGGTSMADSAPSMTTYDVSMEAGILPQTKELGGGVQDVFDTYILPSYEMPSAGGSGHGVTQWYAESNQTGFIGNFVAGAEGHGSVLGQ